MNAGAPLVAALTALLAVPAAAQSASAVFPLGHWTFNPGAERSQVLATGELLGPGRFRVALQSHLLATPVDGTAGSALQLREHLVAAVGLTERIQVAAHLPALLVQRPAPSPEQGLGRPWVGGRVGLIVPGKEDPLWLAVDVAVGIPGLGQAELTGEPSGPGGSLRLSVGYSTPSGVLGAEAELRALTSRVDLRGGVVLAAQGGTHLRGELALRGDLTFANPRGFLELLGGVRYLLRPVELSLLVGPGYGLARAGVDVRVVVGLGFVSPRGDEEPPAPEAPRPDCTEGTPYRLEACPELDFDNDGVLNRVDKCPRDFGPKENEGCPWPDRDGDGTIDPLDNCPDEPGPPDNYGCPREKKQLVVIRAEKLEILEKVFFEFDKATIKPESYPLLDQVAAIIEAHPELAHVRIEGHTDRVGSAEYNRGLSRDRARSVKTYLVEQGHVAAGRLSVAGYGFDRPIDTNDTDEGRAKNRRVEFMIVRDPAQQGEP